MTCEPGQHEPTILCTACENIYCHKCCPECPICGTARSTPPVPPFARTTCACAECVDCCRQQPGSLIPGDAERIAAFLGEPVEPYLWASPGAVVMNTVTREVHRIGTITPRRVNGKCVFLDDQDRCRIHSVAPAGCSHFDTHLSRDEGIARGYWVVKAQQDLEYQRVRSTLPPATSYKPRVA
ncbi:MAG: YkgJ family cysteine cluster protein [Vicinamibacterales bacterium]|nr:YkgJ family cysteine cluster protein [Vicinamibacterales bacterium]